MHPREVLAKLIELGAQRDELIELQFSPDDVDDLMKEFRKAHGEEKHEK